MPAHFLAYLAIEIAAWTGHLTRTSFEMLNVASVCALDPFGHGVERGGQHRPASGAGGPLVTNHHDSANGRGEVHLTNIVKEAQIVA